MNYFLSSLVRDKLLWGTIALAVVAALNLMDFLLAIFGRSPFHFWVVKGTLIAAVAAAIVAVVQLHGKEKKDRRLNEALPGFLEERRAYLSARAAADPGFHTFCHECRHFDLDRLSCLLVLRERKVRIRLDDDSPMRYCLYWNLDDAHPLMQLTARINPRRGGSPRAADGKAKEN